MLHTLYVDMNSFFASCEQQFDPSLRRKPVAVVPVDADTTSVIAASYEAKRFGVKTGTRVGDAKRMCPGLICVRGNHDGYIRVHHRVMAAIDTVIPVDRVCSIDEFACRLLREQRESAHARAVAQRVKDAIRRDCGECLTCSVGLAPNRFLAKVAADMQKPDGLTVLERHELPGRLLTLNLIDLPGIGHRMLERLNRAGVHTVERLCSMTEEELRRAWGSVVGAEWYYRLRGERLAERASVRRTIGHSHVLGPQRRTEDAARAVAVRLLTKLAQRARHLGYVANHLTLGVRYLIPRERRGSTRAPDNARANTPDKWHATARINGLNDTPGLVRAFGPLWDSKPKGPLLKLALTLHDLVPAGSATGLLFEDRRDPARLSKAMDVINRKFGSNALYPASMQDARTSAPRRIAFTNIPDLDVPDVSSDRD